MIPLAHRGVWSTAAERNSLGAFRRAFAHGWGIELDVRDLDGELVVSHDPPAAGALTLDAVLEAHAEAGRPGCLAVNVKADGLDELTAARLRDVAPDGWFAFDMSVPDTLRWLRGGHPVFTRHSEFEPAPALYDEAGGVWLDDFLGGFVTEERIAAHLEAGKRVAVVSPELHGRDHRAAWAAWRAWPVWTSPDVLLCTDHPSEAEEAFA